MAQFYTDFSGATTGQAPQGFSLFGSIATPLVQEDVTATGGKYVKFSSSGDFDRGGLLWDSVPDVSDVEILVRSRNAQAFNTTVYMALARFATTSPTDPRDSVLVEQRSNDVRLGVSGSPTASFVDKWGSNVWFWTRVRLVGTSAKVRCWVSTDPEPSVWDIDTTIVPVSASPVGFGVDNEKRQHDVDVFSVGTNGDPAPTGPVDPGGTDDLTANDISGTSQVSAPTIGQAHALTANDASSVSSITPPAISQAHDLKSTGVSSASATSSAAIVQTHSLTAPDLQSSSQVSSPSLAVQENTDSLTANDISSASAVTSPALGQVHNIAANDVASASETGTPTLRQEHAITSVSLDSLSTVSSPTLQSVAGQDSLAANDISSASEVSIPTLAQVHVMQGATAESASEIAAPALGQIHQLLSGSVESASTLSEPAIRDASQVLTTPIKNTKATVTQGQYKAVAVTKIYKADMIQVNYKVQVA